ncbi:hypothetical protein ONS95_009378 [Cadophora gregata]|uniref:uncharacterized protein n=1 Tax=Cadophora gregata TaxID=51156 RepID=UPI0026DC1D38|nr:uncharacterized protein ONS95_009378 [Cadophora gregata]KAK0124418.1 hypothetical protein ONS95_009378 [Cadophora gregata]
MCGDEEEPKYADPDDDEMCGTEEELEYTDSNDEHTCAWKESSLPDFGDPEICLVHFGHLDTLQNRSSDFIPKPDREIKSWESQFWAADDHLGEDDVASSAPEDNGEFSTGERADGAFIE